MVGAVFAFQDGRVDLTPAFWIVFVLILKAALRPIKFLWTVLFSESFESAPDADKIAGPFASAFS
jgi:hypothetical protein